MYWKSTGRVGERPGRSGSQFLQRHASSRFVLTGPGFAHVLSLLKVYAATPGRLLSREMKL